MAWFDEGTSIGITAGASAPEVLVSELVQYLVRQGAVLVGELDGVVENINFSLPGELRM